MCAGDQQGSSHTTVAQVSYHSLRQATASLVAGATTTRPYPQPHTAPDGHEEDAHLPLRFQGIWSPSAARAAAGPGTGTGTSRSFQVAAAGSTAVADAVVVSGWHSRELSGSDGGDSSSTTVGGGSSTGVRIATFPDDTGTVLALAVAAQKQGRAGSSSSRAGDRALVCELSASVPVLDGVVINPSAVLVTQGGRSSFGLVTQSTWRF